MMGASPLFLGGDLYIIGSGHRTAWMREHVACTRFAASCCSHIVGIGPHVYTEFAEPFMYGPSSDERLLCG